MENRAILAAVLMAVVVLLWQMLFMPSPPAPPPADKTDQRPAQPATTPPAPPAPQPVPTAVPVPAPVSPAPRAPQRTATVDTPLYHAVISSEGGKFLEWTLHYRGEKRLIAIGELGPRGLMLGPKGAALDVVPLSLEASEIRLGAGSRERDLVMTGEDPYGIRVTQIARFRADDYTIDVTIRLENARQVSQEVEVMLPWVAPVKPPAQPTSEHVQWPTEASGAAGGPRDLAAVVQNRNAGEWVGLGNMYYLAALKARGPGLEAAVDKEGDANARIALRGSVTLAPGQRWEARAQIYAGPKEYDRLKSHDLQGAINFGNFLWIPFLPMELFAVPVLWLMHFFYRFVGNYGVSIILLTVITKIVFYPLTVKSMSSMKKMQGLQPQVNALKAKFKSEPQRAQQEMMELYRKQGVNPLGGCLPMLIQVPIFYALYVTLSVAVELQNAPFVCFGHVPAGVPVIGGTDLWICDLASYDPTYILPVLMTVTMFIQQKMTPTTGDPQQAKMMLMMPVVFGGMFIIYPIASGLTLYWTVSNVLQILQQSLMNRGKPARSAGSGAKDAVRA